MKNIKIRLYPNGKIEAETLGMKGKTCMDYIRVIEQLTGARTVDSDYTAEYDESEEQLIQTLEAEIRTHG